MNDVIDFNNVPVLCEQWRQTRTLRNWGDDPENGNGKPYYDHWSDNNMSLTIDENTHVPRMTLTYEEPGGYNFETIYLKWRLPKGFNVMDTLDRLGGYVFGSSAANLNTMCNNSSVTPIVKVNTGHVVARVQSINKMYLGLEHSTTARKNGYVLIGLKEAIANALSASNPTIGGHVISE